MRAPLLAIVVTLAASCTRAPDWHAEVAGWRHPAPLPSFPLVDDAGRAFHLRDLKGEPLFVGFVFTRCPVADACPLTMARLAEVERIAPEREILVVTIDPTHDTPEVLRAFKAKHGVRFRMATGEPEVVEALTSLFNVVAVKRGGVDIAHPVKLALLDEELRPVREWTDNNFDPREIVHASTAQ